MIKKITLLLVMVMMLVTGFVAPVNAQDVHEETPPDDDIITMLAESVGMSRDEFLQELLSGKRIQEVLEENGVSRQSLQMMQQEKQRPIADRTAITALTELLAMTRAEFYQALADGYTVNALLEAQGLSHEDFIAAYRVTAMDQVKQALADGKIEEEQAQKLLAKLDEEDFGEQWLTSLDRKQTEQLLNRVREFASTDNIAPILDVDVETLKQSLRDGSSLGEIIADAGMDEQDVLDQLISDAMKAVQTAIDEGKITAEQGENLLERMQEGTFGQAAWERALNASFAPRDVAARRVLQQMHELVEKFHRMFGR